MNEQSSIPVEAQAVPDLDKIIDRVVADYELNDGEVFHHPSEFERLLIKDAFMALLGDEEWDAEWGRHIASLASAHPTPAAGVPTEQRGWPPENVALVQRARRAVKAMFAASPVAQLVAASPAAAAGVPTQNREHCVHPALPLAGEDFRDGPALTTAARDVLTERERQKSVEGWTQEHDDEHANGEMALAAACYAAHTATWSYIGHGLDSKGGLYNVYRTAQEFVGRMWPWDKAWWKPKDERRNLIRAAALLLAEIERLDRALHPTGATHDQ